MVSAVTSNKTTVGNQTRNGQTGISISAYTVATSSDPKITTTAGIAHTSNFRVVNGLQYTDYGAWTVDQNSASPAPAYVGVYGGGRPGTGLSTTLPTSGTATYKGGATGYVSQADSTNPVGTLATFYGTVQLTADFANSTLTGGITAINAYGLGTKNKTLIGTVNDISVSANLTGSAFTGAATAGAVSGNAFNTSGSTGVFEGGFYGPAAAETAGTFSLTGGTHNVTLLGAFGATTAAPSDARLKTDFVRGSTRADGLILYSWRYRGSTRRHVGPIAQDMLRDPRFAAHVRADDRGFLWVDFAGIGFVPDNLSAMRADGKSAISRQRQAVR